jgi:hypothetical protein
MAFGVWLCRNHHATPHRQSLGRFARDAGAGSAGRINPEIIAPRSIIRGKLRLAGGASVDLCLVNVFRLGGLIVVFVVVFPAPLRDRQRIASGSGG